MPKTDSYICAGASCGIIDSVIPMEADGKGWRLLVELAISTKWMAKRATDALDVIRLAHNLGLNSLELGCDTPADWLEDFSRAVDAGDIVVTSIHNFCPRPLDRKPDGDAYLLSALDEEERQMAVAKTRITIQHASRLGAKAVVLHLGRVEIDEVSSHMKHLDDEGRLSEEHRRRETERTMDERALAGEPHFQAVLRSLDVLLPFAVQYGVSLGLENRLRPRQIPLPRELEAIIARYPDEHIGYWHDVGHAVYMERFGFLGSGNHLDYLRIARGRLVGMHIHDVARFDDHLAPGRGSVDFAELASLIAPTAVKVLEVSSDETEDTLAKSILLLAEAGLV